VELFVREAKTLVSLSHGNIVPVYELGVLEGTYFIAMEYIDGPTLAELLDGSARRDTTMDPAMAAFICAEVLKGLDYAHRKGAGVIHRDLSPRNVMLSRDGEVKIVDFGIAATVDDNLPATDGHDGDTDGGDTSKPVGSFPYMSPEQVRHQALTPASDLFSVGILLWEALAGGKLFARDSAEATLAAVLRADIPAPSTRNAAIPPALDEICLRALARDTAHRYPNAGEFYAKLTRFLYSVETPVTANTLSALVARTCPPIVHTGRLTTHDESAEPVDRTTNVNATQPMPGRGAQGSTRTFATHVQFKKVLDRATPLMPFDAITEAEAVIAAAARSAAEQHTPAGDAVAAEPPNKRGWVGLVAVVAAGAAIVGVLVSTNRSAGRDGGADAGVPDARPTASIDAGLTDAGLTDAGLADAAPPPDAKRRRRPRPDAGERVRGTGTLKIGVKPWAEVYVDGKKLSSRRRSSTSRPDDHSAQAPPKPHGSRVMTVSVRSSCESNTQALAATAAVPTPAQSQPLFHQAR